MILRSAVKESYCCIKIPFAGTACFSSLIVEDKNFPWFLYRTVAKLTQTHSSFEPSISLALSSNDFMRFFLNEINSIKNKSPQCDWFFLSKWSSIRNHCRNGSVFGLFWFIWVFLHWNRQIPTKLFKVMFPLITTPSSEMIHLSVVNGYIVLNCKVTVSKPFL